MEYVLLIFEYEMKLNSDGVLELFRQLSFIEQQFIDSFSKIINENIESE
ncbi:hypothetical protein [Tepidibacter sp. Z1-5]